MRSFARSICTCAVASLMLAACQAPRSGTWKAVTLHEIDSKIQKAVYGPLSVDGMPRLALATEDGRCVVLWQEEEGWQLPEHFEIVDVDAALAS